MLNLFTVKNNKVGVSFGDAINMAFGAFFAYIGLQIVTLLMTTHLMKREIKDLEKQVEAIEGTPMMRRPYTDKVLRELYGNSWESLLTMALKKEVRFWIENILKYSLLIKNGMSEDEANAKFKKDMFGRSIKRIECPDFIPLHTFYWQYLFNKMGYTWLHSSWNGWDKTRDGKIVHLKETHQAEEEYQKFIKEYKIEAFNELNYTNIEQTWFFDNHKSMINTVLKEVIMEHPEYKGVCLIKTL